MTSSKRCKSGSRKSSASGSSTTEWSSTASRSTAIDRSGGKRLNLRAIARIAGLVALFAILAPVHVATKALFGRSPWPSRFLAAAAWIAGVRIRTTGAPVRPHTLIVANHTSWLDILILGGATNCAFVSKDELGHRLIHWLADQNGTVYVRRSHRKGAKDQAIALAQALEGQKPVTVFPEGTVGPGTHLLPFRSTLLEAANFAAKDVEIRPVAIDYGEAAAEISWFQEPGKNNVLRVLRRAGTLQVTVHLLEPLDRAGDRKRLAAEARERIAETLGLTSHEHSPIGERK
jgi:1-acyl-sn-glycerol-3-phosphate acyltransferase